MPHKLLIISTAIVAFCPEACGQTAGPFLDLTAPGDGSVAYFTAGYSGLFMVGNPSSAGTIYKIGPQPATKFLSFAPPVYPAEPPALGSSPFFTSSYYFSSNPQFTRDGTAFAYTTAYMCVGGEGCTGARFQPYQTTVQGLPAGTSTFTGRGVLSGNGRYLLAPVSGFANSGAYLYDLQTGQKSFSDGTAQSSGGRVVSDNGVAATIGINGGLMAFQNGEDAPSPVTSQNTATEAVIDAAGDTIVYAAKPGRSTLRVLRIFWPGQNQDTPLLQANGDSYAPAIDASGTRVTFLSTAPLFAAAPAGVPQLYSINIDGTGLQQLSNASAVPGVVQYALSDDGHIAWYVLGDGRLIKIGIDTAVRTVFHPSAVDVSNTVVPGSAVTFYGANLSDGVFNASESPLPNELGGVRVSLNGIPAPMISVSPTSIVFQAPWETPAGQPVNLQVITHAVSESATLAQAVITPVAIAPAPVPFSGNYGGIAIHQDGSGFVTMQSPAKAGEVVYLYTTGLGPVSGPAMTGVAPAAAASVDTPLASCNVPVMYTGLAPGLAGYYQINIQIPPTIPFSGSYVISSILYFTCGTNMTAVIPTTAPPAPL
jgi:uncharacterized protein (TIGR03437 family)